MTVLTATLALSLPLEPVADEWATPSTAEVLDGWATYYAQGVMAQVAVHRGLVEETAGFPAWLEDRGLVGAVAMNRAGDLRRKVWLEGPGGIEGPFLVMDCAQRLHYPGRQRKLRIVEVDYATAERWGMAGVGPLEVRIYFIPPPYWARRRFLPH